MGTEKQVIIFGFAGYRVVAQTNVGGKMCLEIHKDHSFVEGDTLYVSMIRTEDVKNVEFPGYNGAIEISSVPDATHIVFDVDYDSDLNVTEGMISDKYYIYDSLLYPEWMAHKYDKMILVFDPDFVEPVPAATGFTPGRVSFIVTLEDAVGIYDSIRAARLALEAELYELLNYICVRVGASVTEDFEYLEGISPDGETSVKLATSIIY